jgi:hypothetical protein
MAKANMKISFVSNLLNNPIIRSLLVAAVALGLVVLGSEALNPPTGNPPTGTGNVIGVASNAPANALYVNAIGRVGVGTTSPGYRLDVAGNIQVQNADPYLIWNETDQAANGKIWDAFASSGTFYMRLVNDAYSAATNWLQVTRSGTTVSSVSFPNGNVGIGTTAPSQKLEVSGGGYQSIYCNTTNTIGCGISLRTTDTGGRQYSILSTGSAAGSGAGRLGIYDDTAGSYRMVIDSSGNVGIGTTGPDNKLEVEGASLTAFTGTNLGVAAITGDAYTVNDVVALDFKPNNQGTDAMGRIGILMAGNGSYLQFGTSNNYANGITNTAMTIDPSGNVGIGTTSPTYQLQLSTDSAGKPSTNAWTIVSDRRVKKDIRPYTNGLSIIKRINPVWFKYNGKGGFPADNQNHIGVVGQEIVKVAPYTVNTFWAKLNPEDKKETELLNFNSHALTFDLINAVKELDGNIVKLSQENQELKKANKELAQELIRFKERLSRLEARVK